MSNKYMIYVYVALFGIGFNFLTELGVTSVLITFAPTVLGICVVVHIIKSALECAKNAKYKK